MSNQIIELVKQTANLTAILVAELAAPNWTGLDWDAPEGVDAETVELAAMAAIEFGREAMVAIQRGQFDECAAYLDSACGEEFAFGDHPTWGGIRDAARALAELATDVEADHPSDE